MINATGIILHTALGRAVLPAKRPAPDRGGTVGLLAAPGRHRKAANARRRDGRIEGSCKQLTGAEAATVVNNNAAATAIVLNTVACGKEVIVSRGQLVEIGGSFRLPDVMAASGAKLVEVGTTNKTHARDYEQAITPDTAAILRVHPSNYKISGFTAEVPLEDLVRIGRQHGIAVIDDVGAGPLVDFSRFGFDKEPTLQESVASGGRSDYRQRRQTDRRQPGRNHPRPGRPGRSRPQEPLGSDRARGKAHPGRAGSDVEPVSRRVAGPARGAHAADASPEPGGDHRPGRAHRRLINDRTSAAVATTAEGFSQMGSGSLPTQNLPTYLVAIKPESVEAGELARRLRHNGPPVFVRVHKGQVLVDPRTLLEGEEDVLVDAVVESVAGGVVGRTS